MYVCEGMLIIELSLGGLKHTCQCSVVGAESFSSVAIWALADTADSRTECLGIAEKERFALDHGREAGLILLAVQLIRR